MYVYVCKDSLEGIFSGVYDACRSRRSFREIGLRTGEPEEPELFSEYISVEPSSEKTAKVVSTLLERFGREFYETLYQAAMSRESAGGHCMDKADAIYKVIVLALACGNGRKVLLSLGEPSVFRVFELCRATNREACHLLGFVRFAELEGGVLFSKIHPKNNVLPYLAEHFSDRLPQENFMIYDETRQTVAVHKASSTFFLTDTAGLDINRLTRFSEDEEQYRRLWFAFFDSIAIDSRKNPGLQLQMIPKRFQADTPEFTRAMKPA